MSDYISRDEALKALEGARLYIAGMRYGKTILAEYATQCRKQYIDILNYIPSADVAPVKRGRWITVGKTPNGVIVRKCSNCETVRKGGVKSKYCRDCGAHMVLTAELDGQMTYMEE